MQVAFQVCSGRSEGSRRCARPTAAVSHDSLSSLPPPVPAPARRSSSRSNTATPTDAGISAAAAYEQSVRIRRQPNLILQNPGTVIC